MSAEILRGFLFHFSLKGHEEDDEEDRIRGREGGGKNVWIPEIFLLSEDKLQSDLRSDVETWECWIFF